MNTACRQDWGNGMRTRFWLKTFMETKASLKNNIENNLREVSVVVDQITRCNVLEHCHSQTHCLDNLQC